MYAQTDTTASSSSSSVARLATVRAALRTRPPVQRALIRSWEYVRPVRVAVLAIRLLVTLWLVVLSGLLMSAGHSWGWILLLAAAGVSAFGFWVFNTAAKGAPAARP
ncbi:MAG TPA: hypothetical protein VHT26_08855 [Trebonia sp.]|jgi:hypothetical protein|nr:hypothetical protein [Trebonia sp.]